MLLSYTEYCLCIRLIIMTIYTHTYILIYIRIHIYRALITLWSRNSTISTTKQFLYTLRTGIDSFTIPINYIIQ